MTAENWDLLFETPYFQVSRNGRFYRIHEERAKNAAAVLAVFRGESVVLVEVARPALGGTRREIPRGWSKPGETALRCARRELREETGFAPSESSFQHLGNVEPNSGLLGSSIALFYCAVTDTAQAEFDVSEIDRVHLVPLEEFRHEVATNVITDGFTLSAFALASLAGLL